MNGESCETAKSASIYKSNGDRIKLRREDGGVWENAGTEKWRTDGNKLIHIKSDGSEESAQYEVSGGSITLIEEDGDIHKRKKCSGVVVGG